MPCLLRPSGPLGVGAAAPQALFRIGTAAAFMASPTTSVVEALRALVDSITSTVRSAQSERVGVPTPAGFEPISSRRPEG
jgi:hypothetical protein